MPKGAAEHFYVSKILRAKLVNLGTRKNPNICWVYHTQWDGFSDVTWEPEENFLGDKWALKTFWKRADLNGRNYKHVGGFKTGDVIELATSEVLVKKSGSERSSTPPVPGTRVGVGGATSTSSGSTDDDFEIPVLLKHIRACEHLRGTDTIIMKSDTATISKLKADGTFTVEKELNVEDIVISAWCIEHEWWDRRLSHEHILCSLPEPPGARRDGPVAPKTPRSEDQIVPTDPSNVCSAHRTLHRPTAQAIATHSPAVAALARAAPRHHHEHVALCARREGVRVEKSCVGSLKRSIWTVVGSVRSGKRLTANGAASLLLVNLAAHEGDSAAYGACTAPGCAIIPSPWRERALPLPRTGLLGAYPTRAEDVVCRENQVNATPGIPSSEGCLLGTIMSTRHLCSARRARAKKREGALELARLQSERRGIERRRGTCEKAAQKESTGLLPEFIAEIVCALDIDYEPESVVGRNVF
ncbi:hypothetical protein DFH09DRAFT_1318852 [Mycena vulgaris]|nr:hypothetical protein DFH09DRAFT_1318852 [Mycena vulgaris]